MKKSENKESVQKRSMGNILLSILLALTSLGGIVLYILGIKGQNPVYKQTAVLLFAVYFGIAGLLCLKKQKTAAILFFVLSAALVLLQLFL